MKIHTYMKSAFAIVGALVVLNGFAAEKKESPFKALDEARAGFNKQEGEVFRGTAAADYRTLPDAERFDTAAGAGRWVIALPLKNDVRVRFVAAEFKDGVFVSGEMHRLGLEPEKIDAKAFAARGGGPREARGGGQEARREGGPFGRGVAQAAGGQARRGEGEGQEGKEC